MAAIVSRPQYSTTSVLTKLFKAPVRMPILRRFGQVTHTIVIWYQNFLLVWTMILPIWDEWLDRTLTTVIKIEQSSYGWFPLSRDAWDSRIHKYKYSLCSSDAIWWHRSGATLAQQQAITFNPYHTEHNGYCPPHLPWHVHDFHHGGPNYCTIILLTNARS